MKKLTTFASVALLSTISTTAMAQIAVQGTATQVTLAAPAQTQVGGTGTATGTGTLTGDILVLDYVLTTVTTIPTYAAGSMQIVGTMTIDFGSLTGTNAVASCTPLTGADVCSYTGVGTTSALSNIAGTWQSWSHSADVLGSLTTQTWTLAEPGSGGGSGGGGGVTVTSDIGIPTLPLAGLGLLALGLAGLGARGLRK